MHQMGLAETDPAIEEQRVERHGMDRAGTGLGHSAGGGMRQLVRLADDKVLERETWVKRRREIGPVIRDLGRARGLHRGGPGDGNGGNAFHFGHGDSDLRIDDQRQAVDRRVFQTPQRKQAVGIVGRHPIAQKPGRRGDHGLALVDALDPQ